MRADNSRNLITAAHNRHEYTRAKAIQALRELESAGEPVTFPAVVRKAGVSRSWLYTQPDLRAEIERLREQPGPAQTAPVPARQRASDASLLQRLETANERNRQLTEENRRLRDQLARALGDLRAARLTAPPDKPHRTTRQTPPRRTRFGNDRPMLTRRPNRPTTCLLDTGHHENPLVRVLSPRRTQDKAGLQRRPGSGGQGRR
jgi:hypothetical protein